MAYEISINDAHSSAPTWVKLIGMGLLDTVDDRGPYLVNDPALIVTRSRRVNPDGQIPIDIDHSIDTQAIQGLPSPAAGWVEDFQIREDGVYGRVCWTSIGKAALSRGPNGKRAYRAISPVIEYDRTTQEVKSILRAALVNEPNLPSMDIAVCATESPQGKRMKTTAEKIAQLRAELSANSQPRKLRLDELSPDEKRITGQFTNLSEDQFRAAREKRRKLQLESANASTVKIEPFVLSSVPPPKFVGLR